MIKKILSTIALLAAIAGGVWGYEQYHTMQVNARTTQFNEDVDNLFYALQQYKERIGSYPVGNNAQVVQALLGNNSKNLIILVGRKKELNSKGEFVDPWGTPLRIYFAGEGVLVRSAGPNKRFDDSLAPNQDDYYRSN